LNKTNRKKEIGKGNRRKMKSITNKIVSAGMAIAFLSMTSGLPEAPAAVLIPDLREPIPTAAYPTVIN
jgi:hypothetical protein